MFFFCSISSSSSSCYYLLSMFVVTFCLSNGKKHTHAHASLSQLISSPRSLSRKDQVNKHNSIYVCVRFSFPLCYSFILHVRRAFFTLSNVISGPFITHIHIYKLSFFLSLLFLSFRKILCFPPSVSLIS